MSHEIKWFDVIEEYEADEQPYVSDCEDLFGFEDWQAREGRRIEGWRKESWIQCTDPDCDGPPDAALWNHLGVPIFSIRLRYALEDAGIVGIQYLPLRVLRPDGSEHPGYAVANVLNLVPALDLEKSDYDVFEPAYFLPERRGKVSSVRRAVLKRAALDAHHIIRLAEFSEGLYVSEHFVKVFEGGGFTGWSFIRVPCCGTSVKGRRGQSK